MSNEPAGARSGRRGLRSTLLLGMLVPLLGLAGVSGLEIERRLDSRSASSALEDRAAHLAEVADFLAALAREEVYTTVLAIADDLDLGDGAGDLDAASALLGGVRAVVDSDQFADLRAESALDQALATLRDDLDEGRLGFEEVRRRFTVLDELLGTVWRHGLAAVERTGDQTPLPANVRSRVRGLRDAMATFSYADEVIEPTIRILRGPPTDADLRALLDARARFELSRALAEADAGERASQRWDVVASDPAFARNEQIIDLAERIGTGEVQAFATIDTAAWLQGLRDGATWASRLTDVVRASALDLAEAAAERAADDTRAVAIHATVTALLTVVSAGLALVIARGVARPASLVEGVARRIHGGELAVEPVPVTGPREVAATVEAFNDMASTLATVEQHIAALADDPTAPVLDEALPGRTGVAMQRAIDRLRSSIHDAEAHRAELFERASRDSLTGLLNRAAAFAAIERELARAERDGDDLLALYVDLDDLKPLNDAHGHAMGDEAILLTAGALRATTREADIVARLGGDEFVVVGPVPPEGRDGIEAFGERIRAAVSLQAVTVGDVSLPLHCSIGVVRSPPGAHTAEALVRAADAAMYQAKNRGRDRVVWVDAPPTPA